MLHLLLSAFLVVPCAQEKTAPASPGPTEESANTPAGAFAAMLAEIDSQKPQTPAEWEEKRAEFIAMVKGKFQDFAKKFPDADEGYHARFQLAQIAVGVDGNFEEGVKMLEACSKDLAEKEDRKDLRGKALFLLAQIQVEAGRFPDARKTLEGLKTILPGSPFEQTALRMIAQLDAEEKLAVGKPLPPFEAENIEGAKSSPKAFEGKVLLLDFWATWCAPCRKELPHVKAAYEEFHEKGFEILAISLDENEEKLRNFVKDQKLSWAQCFDGKGWESEVAQAYGIKSIPATFLVDRSGKIRYKNLRGEELKKRVAELIAEPAPAKSKDL